MQRFVSIESHPSRLMSGTDWVVCGIGSIVLHTLSLHYCSFPPLTPPPASEPMAIELVTISETSTPPDLADLAVIPLEIPIGTDPVKNAVPSSLPNSLPNSVPPEVPVQPPQALPPRPSSPQRSAPQSQPPPIPASSVLTGTPLNIPLDQPFTLPEEAEDLEDHGGEVLELPLDEEFAANAPLPIPSLLPTVPADKVLDPQSLDIETIAIVAANPEALQFRVTVQSVADLGQPAINPDFLPPTPARETSIETADPLQRSCTVPTLEALRSTGQPLTLQVTIDDQGHMMSDRIQVNSSAVHPDYIRWVMCILQDWPFSPAQENGTNAIGSIQISAQIDLLALP